ncbi:hypothetical protein AVEN_107568-1 [Araneus ventricosus]|uniref:Uncharacterized protein n=1 Tax=Araneus ventricosus TaxID=182803 RepID=A0A4Y2E801_ARAVE|nr:hypothetical protein AVEN_78710-1 [Araneus ventricosus]GBM23905.1 hypothetical protein AVEN_107568-1 [Araneus ventricosus]
MNKRRGNINRVTLALPWHSGFLNDSHCNRSSTEAGVLIAITDQGPFRRRYVSLVRGNSTSTIAIPPGEARTGLLIRWLLLRELAVPPQGIHVVVDYIIII